MNERLMVMGWILCAVLLGALITVAVCIGAQILPPPAMLLLMACSVGVVACAFNLGVASVTEPPHG